MNRKIKITSVALVCASAVITTSIIFNSANSLSSGFAIANSSSEVWGHYSAVNPEYQKPGSKEFWISCSTHSVSYEAPSTGTIENRGAPTAEQIESWGSSDTRYIPQFKIDDSHLWYGYYPQTNVNDTSLISTLNTLTNPNKFGYYFYDGEYYFKYAATPYQTTYKFNNGTAIVSGTSYWFKVEPIRWKVLENDDGTYFITAESILVNHFYNSTAYEGKESKTDYQGNTDTVYASNYKYSDIRSWLNTDFYDQAFFLGDDDIEVSTVDNSAASTGYDPNLHACENTSDKVFLLSAKELTTDAYGFSSDAARKCSPTDYGKAHGVEFSFYNGCYYTRSPYYSSYAEEYTYLVRRIKYTGKFDNYSDVNITECGVRPSLRISFE